MLFSYVSLPSDWNLAMCRRITRAIQSRQWKAKAYWSKYWDCYNHGLIFYRDSSNDKTSDLMTIVIITLACHETLSSTEINFFLAFLFPTAMTITGKFTLVLVDGIFHKQFSASRFGYGQTQWRHTNWFDMMMMMTMTMTTTMTITMTKTIMHEQLNPL